MGNCTLRDGTSKGDRRRYLTAVRAGLQLLHQSSETRGEEPLLPITWLARVTVQNTPQPSKKHNTQCRSTIAEALHTYMMRSAMPTRCRDTIVLLRHCVPSNEDAQTSPLTQVPPAHGCDQGTQVATTARAWGSKPSRRSQGTAA